MAETQLDFMTVWNDTTSLLSQHKEAAIAIAGVFLFLPAWLIAYFIGQPDLEGAVDINQQIEIYTAYFNDNWLAIMISGLLTSFGTLSYYVILVRDDNISIGSALTKALVIFPIFFVVSIIVGLATALGLIALIIGALYLTGRFSAVAGVVSAEPERGILGSIKYAWSLTHNVGWMAFLMIFIVAIVGSIINLVLSLIFGLIFNLIGGSVAELLTTGVESLLSAILSVVLATLMIAIYRHLKPQVDGTTD